MKDFTSDRNRDLRLAYIKFLNDNDYNNSSHIDILRIVINSPAPRFYISVQQAAKHIHNKQKGIKPSANKRTKQMADDLYCLYLEKRKQHPYEKSIRTIERVVHSSAPQFYISIKTLQNLIYSSKI